MEEEFKNWEPYTLAAIGPIIYGIHWKYMESQGRPTYSNNMHFFQVLLLSAILIFRYILSVSKQDDKNIKLTYCTSNSISTLMISILFLMLMIASLHPMFILELLGVDSLESNTFLLIHLFIIYFTSLFAIIMLDTNVKRLKNNTTSCKECKPCAVYADGTISNQQPSV